MIRSKETAIWDQNKHLGLGPEPVLLGDIPGRGAGRDFETAGVADELVQDADNLLKFWPVVSVLLPAV